MKKTQFANEIYNRYGTVTRARNCFLYTKKNIRLTDMYQENGRAILGWDAGNAFTYFKNVLCRGQVGSFICEDVSRVAKAVSELLESPRQIFYFSNKIDAVKAATEISPASTSVYTPWNPQNPDWKNTDCVIMAPVLPWTETVYILAVSLSNPAPVSLATAAGVAIPAPAAQIGVPGIQTPKNAISIPYAMEAAIARATYNLIEAIKTREEKNWFIYDPVLTKYWERKGPYLYPKVPQNKYDDFIIHCLDNGIVINPDYNSPSIVPFGADKGVFTKLKNSPFIF